MDCRHACRMPLRSDLSPRADARSTSRSIMPLPTGLFSLSGPATTPDEARGTLNSSA